MLTCGNCQFTNPDDHKFCQRCGEPLSAPVVASSPSILQVQLMPLGAVQLTPASYLTPSDNQTNSAAISAEKGRYRVLTVLSEDRARASDTTPEVRSPLQQQLKKLTQSTLTQTATAPSLATLKSIPALPAAAYPYLLVTEAAPPLYDAWKYKDTTVLVMSERPDISPIIEAFSTVVDPLQPVYWMYRLTELWTALSSIPQWRRSLLLADNLGIDTDQSLRVCRFVPPTSDHTAQPPQLDDLKGFLQSLLAQPHRGKITNLQQFRQLTLAVSSAQTLEELSGDLADIGKALLDKPTEIEPAAAVVPSPMADSVKNAPPVNAQPENTQPTNTETNTDMTASDFSDIPIPTTLPPNATSADMSDPQNTEPAPSEPDPIALDLTEPDPNEPDPLEVMLERDALEDTVLQEPALLDTSSDATMVLPMKLVSLSDAGQTDVGRQRDHNEDCFLISRSSQKHSDNRSQHTAARGLYILCDGMGGHDGGEVASRLAARTLSEYFEEHWPAPLPGEAAAPLPDEATVIEAVKLANQAIFEVNEKEQRAGHERMGTTLVTVLLRGTEGLVAHVGDSRLYKHSRRMGLVQMTTDHEVGQREIQRGVDPEIAYGRPDAYQLTQALGPRKSADLVPSVSYLSFSEDTLLLLCSDGLSDNDLVEDYLDSHIDPLLREKVGLEKGLDELVSLANEVNGHDNISAIAICLKVRPDLAKSKPY